MARAAVAVDDCLREGFLGALPIDQSTLSKLLGGEREFTADHARRLAAHFGCDVAMFVQGA